MAFSSKIKKTTGVQKSPSAERQFICFQALHKGYCCDFIFYSNSNNGAPVAKIADGFECKVSFPGNLSDAMKRLEKVNNLFDGELSLWDFEWRGKGKYLYFNTRDTDLEEHEYLKLLRDLIGFIAQQWPLSRNGVKLMEDDLKPYGYDVTHLSSILDVSADLMRSYEQLLQNGSAYDIPARQVLNAAADLGNEQAQRIKQFFRDPTQEKEQQQAASSDTAASSGMRMFS